MRPQAGTVDPSCAAAWTMIVVVKVLPSVIVWVPGGSGSTSRDPAGPDRESRSRGLDTEDVVRWQDNVFHQRCIDRFQRHVRAVDGN